MKGYSLLTTLLHKSALLACLSILTVITCHAQSSSVDSLMKYAGNIHQFNSIFPQEKVYLQFDNTSYYTGETIWFKAFVVNSSTLTRSESRVLYVDLLSPDGILLKQQKLMIVAGQADGSLTLLDGSTAQARDLRGVIGFPSGFYEVRAYTNYMQNFNKEAIFSRVFAVYEKPKQEGHYYDENPTVKLNQSNTHTMRPQTPKQRNINASFYPEGGHLIIGQPCRVAFKITGDDGLGTEATGTLEDYGISFNTVHDGMGAFTFTPTSRRNSVRITVDGKSRSFSLPDAEQKGCAVQAMMPTDDKIEFIINSSDDMKGEELGMTLTCRGELVDFSTIWISDNKTNHTFHLSQLPEGVIRFTLFNDRGDILATRSFYHQNPLIAVPTLTLKSDKDSYGPFEKVSLSFSLSDGKGVPFRDRFCLSVRDSRSQASIFSDDLRTNMLLSSDLKGFIEKPAYYFNSDNPDRLEHLDLLCMVQGWERYDWSEMAGVNDFRETYRLETGLTLNGWVYNQSGRNPLGNVEVTAALTPTDKTLTETYSYITDESGYFGFDIGVDFYDKVRFSIKASPLERKLIGSSARITLERSRTPEVRAYQPGEDVFVGSSVIKRHSQGQMVDSDDGLPTVVNTETGYILPDVEINEHRRFIDYYRFQAYDVVKDVELELDKGNFTTDVYGYLLEKGYELVVDIDEKVWNKEALFTNGFLTYFYVHTKEKLRDLDYETQELDMSPSMLASTIDTRDIKSIMIYSRPMYLVEAWDHSPLYLDHLDKTIDMEKLELLNDASSESSVAYTLVYMVDILLKEEYEIRKQENESQQGQRFTTVDGYSRPFSFYSPEYPTGPIPGDVDYRRTLYWNPNVITDEEGKASVEFYNSSITKHFNIEAAGITASGVPYILDAGF